jgi:hypothetical protein
MPKQKNPELEASRAEFDKLKPMLRYRYGDYVLDHFPNIDMYKLGQAKAGRIVYPEGLEALKMIAKLYPKRNRQPAIVSAHYQAA